MRRPARDDLECADLCHWRHRDLGRGLRRWEKNWSVPRGERRRWCLGPLAGPLKVRLDYRVFLLGKVMESLQAEVAPFGINTTIVNPGFFRTGLLREQSTNYAEPSIPDYDER